MQVPRRPVEIAGEKRLRQDVVFVVEAEVAGP